MLKANRHQSKSAVALPDRLGLIGPVSARSWLIGAGGLLLVLLALAGGLAWSYRGTVPFELDLGQKEAQPFIDGFHDPERRATDGLTYRWTRSNARISVPGFGRRDAQVTIDLAAPGPDLAPAPLVTVLAGGSQLAQIQSAPELRRHTLTIPASLMPGGELQLELRTPTFQPPRDARRLGVLVDHVSVTATPEAAPALPPWRLVLLAGLVVTAAAVVGAVGLATPWLGAALAGLVAGGLVVMSRVQRYEQALWLGEGAGLVVGASLITLVGLGVTRVIGGGWSPTAGRLWVILWLVALVNLLGVAHPQFRSSDLTMNVHRLEDVARGQWLFTLALPGRSAIPAPYPPAFYAVLLPFLPLVNDDGGLKALLITHASALMMVGLASVAFLVGQRVGGPTTGLWAALLHGLAPAGFLLVSQGNFANVFGQWAAGLVLALLVLLPDWRRPLAMVLITAALVLALLGHFGVLLTLLVAVPMLALAMMTLSPAGRRQGLVLLGLFALALVIVVAVYYRHYTGLVTEITQRVLAERSSGGEALGWRAGPAEEWRRTVESLGWLAVPLALAGGVGVWRSGSTAGRLTIGWLAASALFALVGVVLGLSVRYHFFALIGLAVAGAWTLTWLARRGWPGIVVASLLAAGWVGWGLWFWWVRIFWYTRLPT